MVSALRANFTPDEELEAMLKDGRINAELKGKEIREIIQAFREEGLYRFDQIPEALNTLLKFRTKHPNPSRIARFVLEEMAEGDPHTSISMILPRCRHGSVTCTAPAWRPGRNWQNYCRKKSRLLLSRVGDLESVGQDITRGRGRKPTRPVCVTSESKKDLNGERDAKNEQTEKTNTGPSL